MEQPTPRNEREEAWAAFETGDWDRARELFENLLDGDDDPDARDGLGQVLWFLGEIDEGVGLRRRHTWRSGSR